MKRIICVIICAVLLMTGCRKMELREKYSDLPIAARIYCIGINIAVFKFDDNYVIGKHSDHGYIPKVYISADREVVSLCDWKPCEVEHLVDIKGMTEQEVIHKLGEPHVDVGSGLSSPSYVTADGYFIIISFNEADVVDHISKTDILSGEVVEYYSDYIS